MKGTFDLSALLLVLFLVLYQGCAAKEEEKHVTVVGLGLMGKAIVQCYSQKGYTVHAWNRGEPNRKAVQDMNLEGVTVYKDLKKAVEASPIVIMNVVGDKDLKSATDLVKSVSKSWKGRTLVQYTSHEPLSIKEHDKLVQSLGGKLIGGAMMALPSTVCNADESQFLVSANKDSMDALEKAKPTLQELGPVVAFEDDVGLASLADFGTCHTFFYGMAGFEVAMVLMREYGVTNAYIERFLGIAKAIAPAWLQSFMDVDVVPKAIMSRDYIKLGEEHLPASMVLAGLGMHQDFKRKMGFIENDFGNVYLELIRSKVPATHASSEVVEHYFKERVEL